MNSLSWLILSSLYKATNGNTDMIKNIPSNSINSLLKQSLHPTPKRIDSAKIKYLNRDVSTNKYRLDTFPLQFATAKLDLILNTIRIVVYLNSVGTDKAAVSIGENRNMCAYHK